MNATILGAGNIGMALAEGLVESSTCNKQQITLTKRNIKELVELQKKGYSTTNSNIDAVKDADTIFICVLPQQLNELLHEIKPAIDFKKQLIILTSFVISIAFLLVIIHFISKNISVLGP